MALLRSVQRLALLFPGVCDAAAAAMRGEDVGELPGGVRCNSPATAIQVIGFVDFVVEVFRRDRLAERFAGSLG